MISEGAAAAGSLLQSRSPAAPRPPTQCEGAQPRRHDCRAARAAAARVVGRAVRVACGAGLQVEPCCAQPCAAGHHVAAISVGTCSAAYSKQPPACREERVASKSSVQANSASAAQHPHQSRAAWPCRPAERRRPAAPAQLQCWQWACACRQGSSEAGIRSSAVGLNLAMQCACSAPALQPALPNVAKHETKGTPRHPPVCHEAGPRSGGVGQRIHAVLHCTGGHHTRRRLFCWLPPAHAGGSCAGRHPRAAGGRQHSHAVRTTQHPA